MTTVIIPKSIATGLEAEPKTGARHLNTLASGFGCVFLTASVREAEATSALLNPAQIRIYHAASLDDAEERLKLTRSRVLLTNTAFARGIWTDAVQMAQHLRPSAALVVAALLADERLWIGALERGAYDLIQKPFRLDELCRILRNAHHHASTDKPLHMTA